MDSEGFRIKLNLTEFFTDQRKYSYIFIELDKLNDFFDLELRIRRLFAITENIIFLIDNVFVPHSESIKLIHEEETLTLAVGTIGLNELGVNSYFKTSNTKSTQTKDERKRKKKVFLCQEGCKACVHYFQTESCHASSPQSKRKKLQSLKDCNASQNPSYPYKETNPIMPDMETVEIHGSENEMFLRVNKVYDFGRNKYVDINETPPPYKKKVRFKKNFKKNEERDFITEEETINNEAENNSVNDGSQIMSNEMDNFHIKESDYSIQTQQGSRKLSNSNGVTESLIKSHNKGSNMDPIEISGGDHSIDVSNKAVGEILCFDEANVSEEKLISIGKIKSDTNLIQNYDDAKNIYFSEKLENLKNRETNATLISYNNRTNNLINDVPVFTPRVNVHLDRKRTRCKTRRKRIFQQAVSESPNITGLSAITKSSNPEISNIRITDDDLRECINSVTDNLKENGEVYEPIKHNCANGKADNNVVNESCYSNHPSEFCSPLPTKCEAFLARIKTPNPVDIFRKILSPAVVLNGTSCNSKPFQEVTPVDEEQPIIIDCDDEDDTCINLEKYPLINSSPRRGDIVAFKLSKVASDCSSHTTEYIVAEVLGYSRVTSQITVKVQRGLDQLEEPQRRFSIFDDVEESSNKNDTYEFNWNELLETRLIYP